MGEIAEKLGLRPDEWEPYGRSVAKVRLETLDRVRGHPIGRYVLVTAITPTSHGEGKTTTSIGLAMALNRLGYRAVVTLRQPSLGPVFGSKGGGTGGGVAQVLPSHVINLHLTGDAYAVAAANNLLASVLDNHLFRGNRLGLDPGRILWPRAWAVSDRALRRVEVGEPDCRQETEFVITEASEVMAILALAAGRADLRKRLGRIVVGFRQTGAPVTAEDLKAAGAMAALLSEALQPNLLQTTEGTPALVHTGPFANIAHGSCSVIADEIALRCADVVVTEAGFGADMGAEKFFDIKCRTSGQWPSAAVLVATVRALKAHGGEIREGPCPTGREPATLETLIRGCANLAKQIENVTMFGVSVVVAVNAFPDDRPEELARVCEEAVKAGAVSAEICTHFSDGGRGAEALGRAVTEAWNRPSVRRLLYPDEAAASDKIRAVATRVYGADGVEFSFEAQNSLGAFARLGYDRLPVCLAKTPLSLSHEPSRLGRPTGFTLPVREVRLAAGAGFLTALCGDSTLLPGLPSVPNSERVDVDVETGQVLGLS
jgi:formate--tetrahydrofolate ligase